MSWSNIGDSEIATDKGVTTTLMTKIRDDLVYLYNSATDAIQKLLNGSFESYDGTAFTPNSWLVALGDATGVVDPSFSTAGAASFKCTQTGSAGTAQLTSNFCEIGAEDKLLWKLSLRRNDLGIEAQVKIKFYDLDQNACSPVASFTVLDLATDGLPAATILPINTIKRFSGVLGTLAASAIPADCRFVQVYIKLGYGTTSDKIIAIDDVQLIRAHDLYAMPGKTERGTFTGAGTYTVKVPGLYRIRWTSDAASHVTQGGNAYGPDHVAGTNGDVLWFDEGDTIGASGGTITDGHVWADIIPADKPPMSDNWAA